MDVKYCCLLFLLAGRDGKGITTTVVWICDYVICNIRFGFGPAALFFSLFPHVPFIRLVQFSMPVMLRVNLKAVQHEKRVISRGNSPRYLQGCSLATRHVRDDAKLPTNDKPCVVTC